METPKEKIAQRIKKERESKNLYQAKLGKLVGLSGKIVSEIENGKRSVLAEEIALFASALGVSADWLLGLLPPDVKSTDLNTQGACKITGLSQSTINLLRNHTEIGVDIIQNTIDILVNHDFLLYELDEYFNANYDILSYKMDDGQSKSVPIASMHFPGTLSLQGIDSFEPLVRLRIMDKLKAIREELKNGKP